MFPDFSLHIEVLSEVVTHTKYSTSYPVFPRPFTIMRGHVTIPDQWYTMAGKGRGGDVSQGFKVSVM